MILPLLSSSTGFDPVSEFTNFVNDPYVDLPLGLDINKGVVYLWLSGALAILVPLLIIRKGLKPKPSRGQEFLEMVYDTAYTQIARAGLPEEGMRIWFPYVATCFVFIWSMNLLGFIPLPFSGETVEIAGVTLPKLQIYAASANLSVALTLTLVTFFATHIEGIRYNGVVGYFKSWIPSGTPKPILPLLIVVEVLSQLVRLVSLSFRLFFNMLAGHLVIAVFLGVGALMAASLGNAAFAVHIIGWPMGIALYLLEATLIAALQAYIFAALSALYIGGAIHPEH
ncbi:MAG TPA: F0F1 ATP synthase subunit A [Gaiellales bacterium]|nr:F0F1 ATP synthase subunit A [Gaiellales bacterium]